MLTSAQISTGTLGLLAALLAAVVWSMSTVLYKKAGRVVPPVELNLVKGVVAGLLLGLLLAVTGDGSAWQAAWPMSLLLVSGVIGLGIGDTAFFAALNRLGARRVLLLELTVPPMTAIGAWLALGEVVDGWGWIGIAITTLGIAWVVAERRAEHDPHRFTTVGLSLAMLATACQAGGAIIARGVFLNTEVSSAGSALVRILGGTLVLLVILPIARRRHALGEPRHGGIDWPNLNKVALPLGGAILLGTFFGVWLQQTAFKLAPSVGSAQGMIATTPLWVLPLAAMSGEKVTRRSVYGACVALVGVLILLGLIRF
ncbi:MAG: DMT family transporter [Planctomycetota bacterium]